MMRDKLSVVLAVMLVAGCVASIGVAAAAPGQSTLSTTVENDFGWLGSSFDVHEDVVRYGGEPSWVVEVDEDKIDSLESWADESEARDIRDQSGERMVISAPTEDVIDPAMIFGDSGLYTFDYIQSVDYNLGVALVDPVEGAVEPSALGRIESFATSGEFGTGQAFEAEPSTISTARENVGADEVDANGSDIRVAVIDTGLDYDADLYGDRVVAGKDFVDNRGTIDPSSDDYDAISDGNGHGSWVASAVAADPDDSDYTGVAPGAELVIARALGDDGGGETANIVDAVDWACDEQDADIVVMSLGSPVYSESMDDAVTECAKEHSSTVFVAAGNAGDNPAMMFLSAPASSPTTGVVGVGATTNHPADEAQVASFSEVGPNDGLTSMGETAGETPDVAAPGMEVEAMLADGPQAMSGTSMAAPVAAGAAAVAMDADPELRGDPVATAARIDQSSARMPHGATNEVGAGLASAAGWADGVEREQTQEEVRNDKAVSRDLFYESYSTSRLIETVHTVTSGLGLGL